jgi:hypothetical protein
MKLGPPDQDQDQDGLMCQKARPMIGLSPPEFVPGESVLDDLRHTERSGGQRRRRRRRLLRRSMQGTITMFSLDERTALRTDPFHKDVIILILWYRMPDKQESGSEGLRSGRQVSVYCHGTGDTGLLPGFRTQGAHQRRSAVPLCFDHGQAVNNFSA